jgi:YVTN family beta-propeller protein
MLFTDVEGSTHLLKILGGGYGAVLAEHRLLLRAAFAEYGGREMDTQGDAFFVAFTRARDAVGATVAAQRSLAAHPWPAGAECRVRMGLHTGEPEVGDEGYHGMGVHRGARICAAGHGGQILLSNATRELVEGELPAGVALRDLGEQWLKDIDRPERIYQVLVDGLPSEFPPLRTVRPVAATAAGRRRPRKLLLAGVLGVAAAAAAAGTIVLATGGGSKPARAAGEVSANSVGIFRADSGRPTGEIPVGASPSGVAAGFGSVWVSNVDAHSVSRVDPVKGVQIQTIQVGNGPAGIAVGGAFVWVANGLDGTVSRIDPQTDGVVQKIEVGNGPVALAADAYGVWVATADDGRVLQINKRTGKVSRSIYVGQSADGVAAANGSVWIASSSTGIVTRIDARSDTVIQTVQAGAGAGAVAAGPHDVWVANALANTVTRIDAATGSVRATIPVGNDPNGIAVVEGAVWVSSEHDGRLSKIDPATDSVVKTVKTGNPPEGIVFAAGALYVAVRASGAGHRGGTLRMLSGSGEVDTVDPALAYPVSDWQILALTNDGLTGLRRAGARAGERLVPDLAISLPAPTDGGRTYTFQVRSHIRYSNGAFVRPQDFRQAIERSLVLSPQKEYYGGIVGARACLDAPKKLCDLSRGIVTDARSHTVTFHLTAADPDFLYKLALMAAYAVPAGTPLHVEDPLPATGPYEIASYDPKRAVRLVRNPHFREWSPVAQPDGFPDVIVERLGGTPSSRIAAVLRGAADLANDLSQRAVASVQTQHASQVKNTPTLLTFFINLNTRLPPFDDVRARRALNFAIDRQRLNEMMQGKGVGQVTCQILPPNFDGYRRYCPYTASANPSGVWTAPDLEKARQLVRSSGTSGQAVTVWLTRGFDRPDRGRYVVSVLDSLGYKARLRSTGDYWPFSEDKLRVQVGFYNWAPDYPAPGGSFLPTLTCSSYNPVNTANSNTAEFCDPAIDREIARARSLQLRDLKAASQLWAKVDRDLVDQAPWVPITTFVSREVISGRVGNYQYNPQLTTLLGQIWVR